MLKLTHKLFGALSSDLPPPCLSLTECDGAEDFRISGSQLQALVSRRHCTRTAQMKSALMATYFLTPPFQVTVHQRSLGYFYHTTQSSGYFYSTESITQPFQGKNHPLFQVDDFIRVNFVL